MKVNGIEKIYSGYWLFDINIAGRKQHLEENRNLENETPITSKKRKLNFADKYQ